MAWLKKLTGKQAAADRDEIKPSQLAVDFDASLCEKNLRELTSVVSEREGLQSEGLEAFIAALGNKHRLFSEALSPEGMEHFDIQVVETLLDTVFTARRKLPPALSEVPAETLKGQIDHLLHGDEPIKARMETFCSLISDDNRKARRAMWDFAAEILHFTAPEKYPLMSRWVWDPNTVSGALREFIRHNNSLSEIPVAGEPEDYEACRVWLAECLAEQGYYREVHFMVDLVQAQAYTDYVMGMANGMGMMGSEFGGKMEPIEFVLKLLGIDPRRNEGKLRVSQSLLQ